MILHLLLLSSVLAFAYSEYITLNWKLCPAVHDANKRQEQGILLSQAGPSAECIPASVPGTVLANLIANGTFGFQDPYFETNLKKIPDIYTTGRDAWTFFYVANFHINNDNKSLDAEETTRHALLTLRSINYKAELWMDGVPVVPRYFPGVPDPSSVMGMFQRFTFPLGNLGQFERSFDGRHFLAILVHPPLHPGRPDGGQGGSHDLAKDGPVSQFTGGWDWIQATPDRNTGLWDKVSLKVLSGSLHMHDPTVRIRNIDVLKRNAELYFSVAIDSRDMERDLCAQVALEYAPEKAGASLADDAMQFIKHSLQIHVWRDTANVSVNFPMKNISNVQLWYPHTHGKPSLYRATFRIQTIPCNGTSLVQDLSHLTSSNVYEDEVSFRFGIRKVDFSVNTSLGGLQLKINDEKVFLQGGNWVATDQLMRFAGDRTRYAAEVGLHKAMGLNMIRIWGGGIMERPEFFDVCDGMGMLVLSDLWMSGDNNGRWAGSYTSPLNHTLYLAAVKDTFLLFRNHPSLIMYSGGNELYPTSKSPPTGILKGIKTLLNNIAPDTFFVVSTMTNATHFNPAKSLAPKDGPYGMLEEALFYERNPGLWDWQNYKHARFNYSKVAFQPEIGSISLPVLASLLRFMTHESAKDIPGYEDSNIHHVWDYHNYLGLTSHRLPYAEDASLDTKVDHIYQYGSPSNISEYCFRAQLAQFTQFRSMFESFKLRKWIWYTAVLFWKSQSPWPSLRGGLYDWYLGVTGGYYGVRAALVGNSGVERFHGQLNLADHTVAIVTSPQALDSINICTTVKAYLLAGCETGRRLLSRAFDKVSVTANSATNIPHSEIPWVGMAHGDVVLYRVETFSVEDEKLISCKSFASTSDPTNSSVIGYERASIAEYWLSDWTNFSSQPQNLSALGEWRENTALHVSLHVNAGWCNCSENQDLCQRTGCSTSDIGVQLVNSIKESQTSKKTCGANAIAFAVFAELHFSGKSTQKDSRVLPAVYSDGLFSILKNEERSICISPGPGSDISDKKLQVQISGWNVKTKTIQVPKRCGRLSMDRE